MTNYLKVLNKVLVVKRTVKYCEVSYFFLITSIEKSLKILEVHPSLSDAVLLGDRKKAEELIRSLPDTSLFLPTRSPFRLSCSVLSTNSLTNKRDFDYHDFCEMIVYYADLIKLAESTLKERIEDY